MDKTGWPRYGVGFVVLFVLGVSLKLARPVLVPFALALLLAYAVSPGLAFLVRRKVPRPLALVVVLALSFTFLYLLGTVFYAGGKSLASELPSYTEMVRSSLERLDGLVPDPRLRVGVTEWLRGLNVAKAGSLLLAALGPFLSFMSGLLVVFVFMIFILAGRGRLVRKLDEALPAGQAPAVGRAAARIDREVQRYVAVKTLTSLLIGVLAAAVLAALGVRFAVVFGVLAFLFNFVPALGPVVSVALPVLLAVVLGGGFTWRAAAALVLLAAVHVAAHRLLERRLMGKAPALSPLLVLFSLFFGAWLWGIPGLFLAVPALTALRIVFENVPTLRGLGAMMGR